MSVDELRGFGLLKGLDDEALAALWSALEVLSFAQGQRLFEEGDPSDGLLLVRSGALRLASRRHGHCGTVGAGTSLGGASLVAPGARELSADVEADCELWWLSDSSFRTLVDDEPALGCALLAAIARELATSTRAALDSLRESSVEVPSHVDRCEADE